MKKLFLLFFVFCLPVNAISTTEYIIEVAHNDEFFIINDEKYEAQTYCIGWYEGDRVIFLEGSPVGACAYAELYNIDKKEKCSVWCE